MIITIPVNIGARIEGAISNYLRQYKFLNERLCVLVQICSESKEKQRDAPPSESRDERSESGKV